MSSNNSDNFAGNNNTSSNNANLFAEVINAGGGGVGTLYDFYPLNMIDDIGWTYNSVQGQWYVADGATAVYVKSGNTESPYDFSTIPFAEITIRWPGNYGDGNATHAGIEDYVADYLSTNSLSAEKAIPLANAIMKAILQTGAF
jgi:hypothetical protein